MSSAGNWQTNEAEMTMSEFEDGELQHLQFEKQRRIVMTGGLTKDSTKLCEYYNENPILYSDSLRVAINTLTHYCDVVELLRLSLLNLFSATSISSATQELPRDLEFEVHSILSKSKRSNTDS